ncbi:MAG: conjugative transposon protein TraM [Sediminibacterium magnilacihabitans]|jgi:conjugative transposon TraM protein|nr:conjugative transposon protein TraM [Sediminibacterium magnilacihabitans]PQV61527.1 conjugative transposon TraM protein [Sediminibacterium magnilacihabitans]
MEQKTHSQKFLRQRKFLLVLPLLVLPFMTLMFWALGGGSVNHADAQQAQNGLNMQLPGANLKDDKPLDKLSYYEKAASDSMKLQQLMENDPYYRHHIDTSVVPPADTSLTSRKFDNNMVARKSSIINHNSTYTDPNETKVYQKLAQLDAALNNASSSRTNAEENISTVKTMHINTSVNSGDIDRLEQMMQGMNQKEGEDPEMQQLNGMLEKILDIQHPDRVREKIKQTSETKKGQVFAVAVNNENNSISLLDNRGTKNRKSTNTNYALQSNGFYSLDDEASLNEGQNSIQAVIHETQTLVNGSTVKLRLTNDIFINGVLIPKDNFVFGIADLNGERLSIKINSIRYRNCLFPVNLTVCDMDGMDGIYIPGAITRDVAKQSLDRSAQALDFTTLNSSIGAQAAGAGIEAAKTLLSRKVKLVKVTVKAGYQVLLRDEKQKQEN